MKIYTRSGDDGTTGLFGAQRVDKNDARMEAAGTVDELNAALGVAQAQLAATSWDCDQLTATIGAVQHQLFHVGAELATPAPVKQGTALLQERHVEQLEQAIDRFEHQLPPLTEFILPGGDRAAAQLHLARGVCRRAERRVVTLAQDQSIRSLLTAYLNRLSDFLFVAARTANHSAGQGDIPWDRES